jgi:hypothetical protein
MVIETGVSSGVVTLTAPAFGGVLPDLMITTAKAIMIAIANVEKRTSLVLMVLLPK